MSGRPHALGGPPLLVGADSVKRGQAKQNAALARHAAERRQEQQSTPREERVAVAAQHSSASSAGSQSNGAATPGRSTRRSGASAGALAAATPAAASSAPKPDLHQPPDVASKGSCYELLCNFLNLQDGDSLFLYDPAALGDCWSQVVLGGAFGFPILADCGRFWRVEFDSTTGILQLFPASQWVEHRNGNDFDLPQVAEQDDGHDHGRCYSRISGPFPDFGLSTEEGKAVKAVKEDIYRHITSAKSNGAITKMSAKQEVCFVQKRVTLEASKEHCKAFADEMKAEGKKSWCTLGTLLEPSQWGGDAGFSTMAHLARQNIVMFSHVEIGSRREGFFTGEVLTL
jgi:hypothetical protein